MEPIVAHQFDDAPEEATIFEQCLPMRLVKQSDAQFLKTPNSLNSRDAFSVISSDTAQFPEVFMRKIVEFPQSRSIMVDKAEVSDDSSVGSSGSSPASSFPTGLNFNDILCGRGKGSNNFIGNRRFRDIVMRYRGVYSNSVRRADKRSICFAIISHVKQRGGRFLTKSGMDEWEELAPDKVLIKVSQALREGVSKWGKATKQYNEAKARHAAAMSMTPAMAMLAEIASHNLMR